jgi:hypothetical protein
MMVNPEEEYYRKRRFWLIFTSILYNCFLDVISEISLYTIP